MESSYPNSINEDNKLLKEDKKYNRSSKYFLLGTAALTIYLMFSQGVYITTLNKLNQGHTKTQIESQIKEGSLTDRVGGFLFKPAREVAYSKEL